MATIGIAFQHKAPKTIQRVTLIRYDSGDFSVEIVPEEGRIVIRSSNLNNLTIEPRAANVLVVKGREH